MRKDWLSTIGLGLVCVAAVVASFSTLASLAAVAGWGERASWLLPVCLDALGMVATRVWLSPTAPAAAQAFAKRIALAAIIVSIAGNAAGHLASTGHLSQGLLLVVLVGAVPPAGLAAGAHLADLRRKVAVVPDAAPIPAAEPAPTSGPTSPDPAALTSGSTSGQAAGRTSPRKQVAGRSKPKVGARSEVKVDEVELQRARHADRTHQVENEGRPITRDALKKALGCSTDKAAALLAALKKEREAA